MRVFVPVDDDWDGRLPTTGERPVPYRAGLPLWHQALSPKHRVLKTPEPGDARSLPPRCPGRVGEGLGDTGQDPPSRPKEG